LEIFAGFAARRLLHRYGKIRVYATNVKKNCLEAVFLLNYSSKNEIGKKNITKKTFLNNV